MNRKQIGVILTITIVVLLSISIIAIFDGDNVPPHTELQHGTNPFVQDTDNDGLDDGAEIYGVTSPTNNDTDGDKLSDGKEKEIGANPLKKDTDGDGLTDYKEYQLETDPASTDTDNDNLSDYNEVNKYESNPLQADTDNDGINDGKEVELNTSPTNPDMDSDGLPDGVELKHNTDIRDPDTDNDGINDNIEINIGTNPLKTDTDDDGLSDSREYNSLSTNPTLADTDSDGLSDPKELQLNTNATNNDTDGDGIPDGAEVKYSKMYPNASPLQKDIFIEIDTMESANFSSEVKQRLQEMFINSPVNNPSQENGIHLHLRIDNTSLSSQDKTSIQKYYDTYYLSEHQSRGYGYHHALVVNDVTLNNKSKVMGGVKPNSYGILIETSPKTHAFGGLFLHELGHSLGLTPYAFDGIDSHNYSAKNYTSIMNYNYPENCGEPRTTETLACNNESVYKFSSNFTRTITKTQKRETSWNETITTTKNITYSSPFSDWGFLEENMKSPPTNNLQPYLQNGTKNLSVFSFSTAINQTDTNFNQSDDQTFNQTS